MPDWADVRPLDSDVDDGEMKDDCRGPHSGMLTRLGIPFYPYLCYTGIRAIRQVRSSTNNYAVLVTFVRLCLLLACVITHACSLRFRCKKAECCNGSRVLGKASSIIAYCPIYQPTARSKWAEGFRIWHTRGKPSLISRNRGGVAAEGCPCPAVAGGRGSK